MKTSCVSCSGEIELRESTYIGEVVECGGCGVELEVTSTEPATVALAPEPDEDWGE